MCGIAGLVSWTDEGAAARVKQMTDALAHRGPDDAGVAAREGVFLGHRRLSIIDLSANGHQPMSNEDGAIWLTYNGELYDTLDLRRRLKAQGHAYRSATDSEDLIHLYEEKGVALFPDINGMFAFAVHDRTKNKLLLARDRLGVKPLFYAFIKGEFYFASEIKGIIAGLGYAPSLRPDALGQYILQGYATAPDTVYEGIRQLPPGHYLEIDLKELQQGRLPQPTEYWDAAFTGDDERPVEQVAAELEALLSDAARVRLVADVPLGAFLSGGVDSSVVVALMAQNSPQPVRTFHIQIPHEDFNEREKALSVAQMWKTDHREIISDAAGADDYWPRLQHFDAPFNCPSLLNTWLVCRAARREVTVALSGDGGDELFAGYSRYLRVKERGSRQGQAFLRAASAVLPGDLRGRAKLAERGADDFDYFFTINHPLPVAEVEKLVGASLRDWTARMRSVYERYPADAVTRATYLDLKNYLADHIHAKVDSASMAVSLETRAPFMDYRVAEFAGRLSVSHKIRDGKGKWLLKHLARKWLPEGLVDQKKVGFEAPVANWIFQDNMAGGLGVLAAPEARFRQHLDGAAVDRWRKNLATGGTFRVPQRAALWSVYQFEKWLQTQNTTALTNHRAA
jgi:asparagine synthase (glutamine-hydrolysing)